MLMIFPRRSRKCFNASRETRNGPRVFEANIASHCLRVISLKLHRLVVGGIVDQDIDPAQFFHRFLHRRPHALFVCNVATQGHRARPEAAQIDDGMLRLGHGVAKRDRNIRPGLRQPQRDGTSQAKRRSRDQNCFAGKRFRTIHAENCNWNHRILVISRTKTCVLCGIPLRPLDCGISVRQILNR